MTVLLVDDALLVRARLRERLEAAGRTVLEARDGAEAADVARTHEGAIRHVILDVHVPGIAVDGVGRLRAALPGAVLIVLTNEASALHRRDCLARGADYFFDKSHEFERAIGIVLREGTTAAS